MNSDKNNLFTDKNILIFGLGKSGLSSLKKLAGCCKSICALDNNPMFSLPEDFKKLSEATEIKLLIGSSENSLNSLLDKTDLIIVSPGISMSMPLLKKAVRKKIKIWSELELAWAFMSENQKRNTIAITGTNGKTTVTTLIENILNDSGLNSVACGNIGKPLIDTLTVKEISENEQVCNEEYLENLIRVIEVSSFQLENTYSFNPHVGIILNITNDHIDRHDSMAKYARIKFKISQNQSPVDFLIVNDDDKNTSKFLKKFDFKKEIKSKIIRFGFDPKKSFEIVFRNEDIFYSFNNINGLIPINGRNLIGRHNIANIMSSVAAAKIFGAEDTAISKSVIKFVPLHHRLEYFGTINGVKCFNDSKATNPDAVIKALEHFQKEVTLILGGLDKGMDFKTLIPAVKEKVLNLILIGASRELLFKTFSEIPHEYMIFKADSLEEAVSTGMETTKVNNTFLLSPACASMDMFKDYKDRGDQFKRIVLSHKK